MSIRQPPGGTWGGKQGVGRGGMERVAGQSTGWKQEKGGLEKQRVFQKKNSTVEEQVPH